MATVKPFKRREVFLVESERVAVIDIETDDLDATVIHCIVTQEEGEDARVWLAPFDTFKEYAKSIDRWVGHNALEFDIRVINDLLGMTIELSDVIDTLILGRLLHFTGVTNHMLSTYGLSFNLPKIDFHDYSTLSQEMIDYCIRDVGITLRIYLKFKSYLKNKVFAPSIWLEHYMSLICSDMTKVGFYFNKQKAEPVLSAVESRMEELEKQFQFIWPPELQEVGSIKYRIKIDGTLYKNVSDSMQNYPKTEVRGSDLILYDWIGFNPGSAKDRVEKLWESGWQPTEKTKTHYEFTLKARPNGMWRKTKLTPELYKEKKEYFAKYGWAVSEENLLTLPERAPEGASALSEWLTLQGRRSALRERLENVGSDYRIHARFTHIGAWTHRMAHSSPNLANISSPFFGEPNNPVEVVKSLYDAKLREMFCVDGGHLVGTDADGIQLRILAHYLRSDAYVDAIVSGRKEDGTDIHNLNRRALGLDGVTRDNAKTFIYAWLLGAGSAKVARILGCSLSAAKEAVENFIASTEGLSELKSGQIQSDARRGYFIGLDGRRVVQPDAYYMLAGYLQNGESVVMKLANTLWREWADQAKISYKQVNFVHDEWQTQVMDSLSAAEEMGHLQRKSIVTAGEQLGCYCPLAGSTNIGFNWLETH